MHFPFLFLFNRLENLAIGYSSVKGSNPVLKTQHIRGTVGLSINPDYNPVYDSIGGRINPVRIKANQSSSHALADYICMVLLVMSLYLTIPLLCVHAEVLTHTTARQSHAY